MLLFHDPKFWLATAFAFFVIIMAKYVWPFIIKMIDEKKNQIISDIREARDLRDKAAELMKQAEEYHEKSIIYSENLIKEAKIEAENLINDSQKIVQDELDRRVLVAKQRIEQEEENAIREVKNKIITSAIESIENNILKSDGKKSLKSTIDKAIVDVSKLVH